MREDGFRVSTLARTADRIAEVHIDAVAAGRGIEQKAEIAGPAIDTVGPGIDECLGYRKVLQLVRPGVGIER
jgi:hypothetical protein